MQRPSRSCIAGLVIVLVAAAAPHLGKRTPYSIPLAKLSLGFDEITGKLSSVRVAFEGSDDFATITPSNDEFVRQTGKGREKTLYREQADVAYLISDFEAEQLRRVIKSFTATLQQFEKDLQGQRWDKALYLDSYFPRFLRGFYYLCDAMCNSVEVMPRSSLVPDTVFDVSIASPKSDARIGSWRDQPNHVIKMRIMARELAYQLQEWDRRVLASSRRDHELFFDTKVKEAYSLFIRLYFNQRPQPDVPVDGKHLR